MSKNTGRRAAAAIALTGAAALLLSGCFSGGGSGGASGDGDARIQVAFMQPPKANMNPFSDDAFKLSRWSTGETLVQLNDDIEIDPMLATEWEQVDDVTWTFTLRDDVTFHDGTPFNAEAVKNTLDQAMASTTPPRAMAGVALTTEATGEYEVTITTDVPDPLLPNRLASPQLSILSAAAYKDDGTITPIGTGTGPFVLTDVNGSTTATLDRFDDYWGEPAKIAGIDASFVPDGTARAGSLRSGETDVAETIPVSQIDLLDADTAHEVLQTRTTYLALNSESGPFADPAVRAAARAAIDPSGIVDSVYEGHADPAVGLLGPAIPWAEDLRGDVESATAPGTVAGVEITLATYTDRAELPEIAVQLEKQLEDAGFVVTQDVREYANMETELLSGGFDAVVFSRNTLLDTGDPLSFFAQDFTCEGGNNVSRLCDPAVDALVAEGQTLPLGEDRQKATLAAEEAILQLDAAIPLVHDRVVQGEAGTFADVKRDPLERRLITELTAPVQ
ncbi:ABC transporter substrate-binding protein [Leucobacter rhizosphaerae]|uniref:ABC transporter substrate-binding protein n=1 Tax=Leucobacter rhizosphaerae TaxID=2932245 RepID=A0ABY4FT19_9MICO|nr:ABC transporter substrate-binding protein [Leucobacter rhizosphaerae]UOQ59319.1 ABC transporter substrate-binding protein [Leucobacter rhizosphaerae]